MYTQIGLRHSLVMDRLTVGDARILLQGALAASSAKEAELQLMVGSRYHELIESADAIVSMHSTANELRLLLQRLPQTARSLIDPPEKVGELPKPVRRNAVDPSAAFRLTLTLPPRIWTALDKGHYFDAASAFLEYPSQMITANSAVRPIWFDQFQVYFDHLA